LNWLDASMVMTPLRCTLLRYFYRVSYLLVIDTYLTTDLFL